MKQHEVVLLAMVELFLGGVCYDIGAKATAFSLVLVSGLLFIYQEKISDK